MPDLWYMLTICVKMNSNPNIEEAILWSLENRPAYCFKLKWIMSFVWCFSSKHSKQNLTTIYRRREDIMRLVIVRLMMIVLNRLHFFYYFHFEDVISYNSMYTSVSGRYYSGFAILEGMLSDFVQINLCTTW